MSVLKTSNAHPSRFRGVFRYLLHAKDQREDLEILAKKLSPDTLVQNKPSSRPMFEATIREGVKCRLFSEEGEAIVLNPDLPEIARNPATGDRELPNTLANLFFASGNEDEYDFGLVCAWFLCQDVYDPPNTWERVQLAVKNQGVDVSLGLKMTSDTLYSQMVQWMRYMGLLWIHALNKKTVIVPDSSLYIKRNLKDLFAERGEKIAIGKFIDRLAKKCPLFETGHFRERIETYIGSRSVNSLSTSTAFALFRLQEEGYLKLTRESDADLLLLPKSNGEVDDSGRVSHIIYLKEFDS
jgi:hypothetical protein